MHSTLSELDGYSLIASSGKHWGGTTVDHFNCQATGGFRPTSANHLLLINFGSALEIEWMSPDRSTTAICETGRIVAFVPAGADVELSWRDEFKGLSISFDSAFVNRVLENNEWRWTEQRNFEDAFLLELVDKLRTGMSSGSLVERVHAESLLVTCVMHMGRSFNSGGELPKGKLSPQQLKKVIDFAYSCMQVDIGLEELASIVHLSPYHFGRLFKQTVGSSPYQFLLQMKIEYSKKLIKQHAGPIGDIAYQLNFSDLAHFSNAFRKATGISPRQFQASH